MLGKLARPVWGWGPGEIPGLHHRHLRDLTCVEIPARIASSLRRAQDRRELHWLKLKADDAQKYHAWFANGERCDSFFAFCF